MIVVDTVAEFRKWRQTVDGRTVGFVPTMGALHEGHASLIARSVQENDLTVVSIFVNPAQFGPDEDLDKYPRTMAADRALLKSLGVTVLFAPAPTEMYPRTVHGRSGGTFVTVDGVSEVLEGSSRPGFFRGVATVVTKLLNIVAPQVAYFGQKDIQQFIVLETMVNELFMNVKLQMCPIVRNEAGLALSSRNKYMGERTLVEASKIYAGLMKGVELIKSQAVTSHDDVVSTITKYWAYCIEHGLFEVDYVSVADRNSLAEVENVSNGTDEVIISCAVFVTDLDDPTQRVRLIDNVTV